MRSAGRGDDRAHQSGRNTAAALACRLAPHDRLHRAGPDEGVGRGRRRGRGRKCGTLLVLLGAFLRQSLHILDVATHKAPSDLDLLFALEFALDLGGDDDIEGGAGDDHFVFDDNRMSMTVYGRTGNDTFQMGQMYRSPRLLGSGLAPQDYFETTQTTRGFLSNGISFSSTMYGGDGDDTFTVYRTTAELTLLGENDDDIFRVRAFVKVDPNDPKNTDLDGALARSCYLKNYSFPEGASQEWIDEYVEALDCVAELKKRKHELESDEYYVELERLFLDAARANKKIRALAPDDEPNT